MKGHEVAATRQNDTHTLSFPILNIQARMSVVWVSGLRTRRAVEARLPTINLPDEPSTLGAS